MEYAQSRGFVTDPARVRTPTDKPRVERVVPFVRSSMFAGESFVDLDHAQRHAEGWCRTRAGLRTHGTTQCRPAELFALEEQPRLLAAPTSPYDLPVYATPKVHRDHHVEVAKALYSVPGNLIGERVDARADRALVRISHRGQLVKVHPRMAAGGRSTDPDDLPSEKTAYALRDIEALQRMAARHGPAIGAYAAAVLEHPLPWTKMRQVYALLGLVKRWGPERVEAACSRALEAEAISVGLIGRMIERATEAEPAASAPRRRRTSPPASPVNSSTSPHPGVRRRPPTPTPPSPREPAPPAVRCERAGTGRHRRAARRVASAQARPLRRHAARAPGPGPQPQPGPRRVPGAGAGRRGDPAGDHLGRAAVPGRRARARHVLRALGRGDQGDLRPGDPRRAVLAALRRRRPQRRHHGPVGRG